MTRNRFIQSKQRAVAKTNDLTFGKAYNYS